MNSAHQLTPFHLGVLVASRLVLNTVFRITYPLIPFVALRYAVSAAEASQIVTISVLMGCASLAGGWLGDRVGLRPTMLLGLMLTVLGTLLVLVADRFGLLLAAFALCGTGTAVYQPAMQAYVSALTPFAQRGRAIGIVELSWALAGMSSVPLLLALVDRQQSLAGTFLLLAIALVVMTVVSLRLPPDHGVTGRAERPTLRAVLRPEVLALLALITLCIGAVELFFVVQPVWASAQFGLELAQLGTASVAYGIGELVGSLGSTVLTDRLGKRRAALLGFALAAAMFLLVATASFSWPVYLLLYALMGLCVEFAIVATLTLASTVAVVGRGMVMALAILSMQLGRAVASREAVALLAGTSFVTLAALAAAITVLGVVIGVRYVHETERAGYDPVS